MLSVIVGLVVAVVSFIGMWRWRQDLGVLLRGLMPLCFFLAGIIAVVAGASSFHRPTNELLKKSGESPKR